MDKHSHNSEEHKHHLEEHEHHHHNNEIGVFEAIRTRRSIRKYQDRAVEWDKVIEILQAGKYAPFAGNILNCKFIVVKNEDKRRSISQACSQLLWMQDAPIHIVIVGEPEKQERFYGVRGARLYTVQGSAAAAQNMLLTATSLGLGSCWIGAFDEEEIRRICNMPEHINVQAIITLGYAAEHPAPPPKYRIEHVTFFEKWWGRIESPKNALGMWSPAIMRGVNETKKHIKKAVGKIKEKLKKK